MKTPLAERLGLTTPLFAFTRSPEVVVAVSRAGGLGVLGAVACSPEELARDLDWIDAHVGGRPYGVDVVMPASYAGAGEAEPDFAAMIPAGHRAFVDRLLADAGVPPLPPGKAAAEGLLAWTRERTLPQVGIALEHPIALLANALGPPPAEVITAAHGRGVLVAALCGSVPHARKQVAAGVDVLVAQGWEAGGHTGEIASMVLVPDVVDAVGDVPVLAAGGIGSGRQLAAALCLGAQGAWTGSIWLDAAESDMVPALRRKLHAATAADTIRSKALTGKPARQLRTAWTEAWEGPASPGTLPLPLQWMVSAEAQTRLHTHAEHPSTAGLLGTPVGQVVGRMRETRPAAAIVEDITNEARAVLARLGRSA